VSFFKIAILETLPSFINQGRRSDRAALLVRVSQKHQGKITYVPSLLDQASGLRTGGISGSWLSACNHHITYMFVDAESVLNLGIRPSVRQIKKSLKIFFTLD
jgi:hypothetical protein